MEVSIWMFMYYIELWKCCSVGIRRVHRQSVHHTAIPTTSIAVVVLFRP